MRKSKEVTITAGQWTDRDAGKTFLITEMSAGAAEKWALRAMTAMLRSGMDIPDDVIRRGMAGLVIVGIRGLMNLSFPDAELLMDEMMACVQIKEPMAVRRPTEDDIEEVATRMLLRSEVIDLHVGFSLAGWLSKTWQESRQPVSENLSNSPTSQPA